MDSVASAGFGSPDRCPVGRAKVVVMAEGQAPVGNASLRVDRPSARVTAERGRSKSWLEVPLRFTRRRVGSVTAAVEAAKRKAERPDPERVPPSALSVRGRR